MLDVPTLIFMAAAIQLVMAGVLLLVWRTHPDVPGIGLWCQGFFIVFVGVILIIPREIFPPLITVVLSNSLIALAGYFSLAGIREYKARVPYAKSMIAVLFVPYVGGLAYFSMLDDNISIRVLLAASLPTAFYIATAWQCFDRRGNGYSAVKIIGVAVLAHAAFILSRGILSVVGVYTFALQGKGLGMVQVTFIEAILAAIFIGVAMIMATLEYRKAKGQ